MIYPGTMAIIILSHVYSSLLYVVSGQVALLNVPSIEAVPFSPIALRSPCSIPQDSVTIGTSNLPVYS